MKKRLEFITRRDFIRGAACTALGSVLPFPPITGADEKRPQKTTVVLIRDEKVIDSKGRVDGKIAAEMLDRAVMSLHDVEEPREAWKQIVNPDDVVGIKSNEWSYLPTPAAMEQVLKKRVIQAGVSEKHCDIADRAVLRRDVFQNATALINIRPLRTHHWSGIGGCIKNPIMFDPDPSAYHGNYCADLARLWQLPIIKDKTRLNILVVFTPLFHGIGAHHFDSTYTWPYKGILVGRDPVALDALGVRLLQAKRHAYFGKDKPMKPTPHHVMLSDTRHHLGTSDLNKIELVKLGWQEDILI